MMMRHTEMPVKLVYAALALAAALCGRPVGAATEGGGGEEEDYRVHFTSPSTAYVKLGDTILYKTVTECRLQDGSWTSSPPSTITVYDPDAALCAEGTDSVAVTASKTGTYTATASCDADPAATAGAVAVTALHTDIAQAEEESCVHRGTRGLTLSAGDAGHVDSFDGGGGWAWGAAPAGGLDCGDDGYKTFTYTPQRSEPGSYAVTAAANLLPACQDACAVHIVEVDLAVEGVADEDEADAPGGLVCVTNGPGQTATRKALAVSCQPTDWDGSVQLLWAAGNVKVYNAATGGVEMTSGTTFANAALPTNLWVEGVSPSTAAGDVVFRLNPVGIECPNAVEGCGRVVMTVVKVDLSATGLDGAVTNETEDTIGAYVHWNLDNDDASDNTVGAPKRSGADYLQTGAAKIAAEDDLKPLAMSLQPDLNQGSVVLNIADAKAKVWKDAEKGSANLVLAGSGDKTWNLADVGQKADFVSLCSGLWVEGAGGGTCDIKLSYTGTSGVEIGSDTVKYTFIAADCGQQPKTDPPNERDNAKSTFPNLIHCEWSITDGATPVYNCIAW